MLCLHLIASVAAIQKWPARGGADAATAFSTAMDKVNTDIVDIEVALASGKPYEGSLRPKFDAIFATGTAAFKANCADKEPLALFESALDARLELLFVKQLACARAKILADFRPDAGDAAAEFDAVAIAARRTGATWDANSERDALGAVVTELKTRHDRAANVGAKASAQQSSYRQLFQTYQAQIQQLQAATQAAPPQIALAYRLPETDLAVSAGRQGDRTTLSLTCVPDDSAPLLGPQGFVKGVSPANVGFTLNLHV